jgi:predicted transcriptional regulator
MSGEAVGYVYRHSPYNGATFNIHLAIADVVNDAHHNKLWMATDTIAQKTRTNRRTVQRAIDTLCNDGFMELVEKATQHRPATYRFLFPNVDPVWVSEQPGVTSDPPEVTSHPSGVTSDPPEAVSRHPNSNNSKERKEPSPSSDDEDQFNQWWTLYPRKTAKQDARKAWKTATKQTPPADIIAATRHQTTTPGSPLNREPQYVPYPASWLRAGQHLDTTTTQPTRETRPYDQPANTCTTCDGTRYISHQDQQDRWYSTPCPDCQ